MTTYIIERIIIALLVVFLVSVFAFSLMHLLPGDPARLELGFEASEEDVQALREEMNLDKPVPYQYVLWIKNLFKGTLGDSVVYKRPVRDLIAERLPRTVSIGICALMIGVPFGILFGVICSMKRGKLADQIITFLMTLVMGIPVFWLGILLILIFAIWIGILPIQGYVNPSKNFGQFVLHAILPVLCMSGGMSARLCRQTRTNMLDSINQDYIRTARANGLSERSVIYKHSLRNALIPVISVIGLEVRVVIGGSLLVEQIFNIPGIGTLLTAALNSRDYMIVQNCTLLISLFTVAANLLVDIAYGIVDPRIRLSRR